MHDEIITLTYERVHPIHGRVRQSVQIAPELIEDFQGVPGLVFERAFQQLKDDATHALKMKAGMRRTNGVI